MKSMFRGKLRQLIDSDEQVIRFTFQLRVEMRLNIEKPDGTEVDAFHN
jgi:hypothetical protein